MGQYDLTPAESLTIRELTAQSERVNWPEPSFPFTILSGTDTNASFILLGRAKFVLKGGDGTWS